MYHKLAQIIFYICVLCPLATRYVSNVTHWYSLPGTTAQWSVLALVAFIFATINLIYALTR